MINITNNKMGSFSTVNRYKHLLPKIFIEALKIWINFCYYLIFKTIYIFAMDLTNNNEKFKGMRKMMEFLKDLPSLPYPVKALIIFIAAVILLRIAGKRSLAETTVSEAVLRISIGAVLIQPLALRDEWEALYGGTLLIIGIVLLAKIQIWLPKSRKYINGVPSVLIKDGQMKLEELKKARLTTDELQSALRLKAIGSAEDVELAILESNGKISTILKQNKAPATKEDIQKIMDLLAQNGMGSQSQNQSQAKTPPLFQEAYDEGDIVDYKPQIH